MIYDKRLLFTARIFNNLKEKPPEIIRGFLEEVPSDTRVILETMLKNYKRKSVA